MSRYERVRRRRGFTLIELLVVVLVLGVLAAIAIPRFSSARTRAQDATARADLRSALTTALTARAAGGAWPDATALAAAEAALRTTSGNAAVGTISVANPGGTFRAAALSPGGTCFRVTADANGTPTWTQDATTPCTALEPLGLAYADQGFAAGTAETLAPTVTGGLGSGRTFSITAGTLPAGVTLNPTTGALATTGLTGSTDGTLDTGFADGLSLANGAVQAITTQADGKTLLGGSFTQVNGASRNNIARLNVDGTLDTTFGNGVGGTDGLVDAVAVQADGKTLIGGTFTTVGGTSRVRLARLNADGSLDAAFGNGLGGATGQVRAIVVQPDGRILVGGDFGQVHGGGRAHLVRLNADGSPDATFANGQAAPNGAVWAIAVQPDGRILVGGAFTTVNGTTQVRVARLNADGTHDPTLASPVGPNMAVRSVARQSDGKVVIGGEFTSVAGTARGFVARLNADGTLDTGFANGVAGADNWVEDVAVQPDGRVLVAGWYTTMHGVSRNRIARLTSDGSLDTGFATGNPLGASGWVYVMHLASDGKVLIGGAFTSVNNQSRSRIARFGGVTISGFPAALTVQVAESGGGTASANLTLTVS